MDWNMVVTVRDRYFREARQFLQGFGRVDRTDYFNVLTMDMEDPFQLLTELQERVDADPDSLFFLARVVPVTHTFYFQSAPQFEDQAREVAGSMAPHLAGKNFFVRMHRRGFKGRLASTEEERFLDDFLLQLLQDQGTPGRINFAAPEAVIDIETIGQYAGMAMFTGPALHFSLLKLR